MPRVCDLTKKVSGWADYAWRAMAVVEKIVDGIVFDTNLEA